MSSTTMIPPKISDDNLDGPSSTHGRTEDLDLEIPPEVHHGQVRGSRVGSSVFTAENILEMRGRVAAGESQRHVAKEFGADLSYMSRIVRRKVGGWLPHREPTQQEIAKAAEYVAAMEVRKPGRSVKEAMRRD